MRNNGSTHAIPSPEKAIATLTEDLSSVKNDLATLVRSGRRHIVGKATDGAKLVAGQARDQAAKAKDTVGEFAAERPFTTIAVSAVGGMVIAGMLARYLRR